MRKLALLILDGAGYADDVRGNAVTPETMPRLFETFERNGVAVLEASGLAVGLQEGQVGNSEAGHLTIGAGCVVPSTVRRLEAAFEDGSWAADPMWQEIAGRGVLHVTGLLSDAGVHALGRTMGDAAELAAGAGVTEILVHPVLDGVDSRAGTAPALLGELKRRIDEIPGARLGVIIGRKWFCDRSGDLEVSRVAARAFTGAAGLPEFTNQSLARHLAGGDPEMSFEAHLTAGGRFMAAGETVLISNHRADRIRQMVTVLAETQKILTIVDPGVEAQVDHVFFPLKALTSGLAHELRSLGLKSKRIAEKCKFPHVTFFLNGFGGVEGDGICIPSIPEAEIPGQPEMSIAALTEEILDCLRDPDQKVVIANIPNLDQVGHTGKYELAERAARAVDKAYEQIAAAAQEHGWTLLVTADHGNADLVETPDGKPYGSHTDRPVPFTVEAPPGVETRWISKTGSLANVAATCLEALDVRHPDWMEPSLIKFETGGPA